ncbi:HNH endonuclease [Streptomyces rochei]|uniref:HNH endonuclease signature motif containing protein n=1 Tax=Streptomyces TaxID=1883 RepID=UPI001B36CA36|nr:HNH endonuclease [Streptomyces sp. RT42]
MSSGVRYTRDRLAEAAEQCSTLDEVIHFFGAQPSGDLRRYLAKRFAHYGIEISHFAPAGSRARPSAVELRAAVAEGVSIAGVLRRLGRHDSGAQRALLRRWIAEDDLSTAHFLGQAHRRGKPSTATPLRQPDDILVKHGGERRTRTALLRRALRAVGVPDSCDECGTGPEWLGRPMTLEVDHVNGDWSDDRRENLRLLCPNCHAAGATWCRGGRQRHTAPSKVGPAGRPYANWPSGNL